MLPKNGTLGINGYNIPPFIIFFKQSFKIEFASNNVLMRQNLKEVSN